MTGDSQPYVELLLRLSVLVFMVGNLLAIGLETDLKAALSSLCDLRFVVLVMLLDWLICPGFAWLLTAIIPIAPPYAAGLMLIGLAPAAPFLPMMVRRAGGDLAYAAAFMLVAVVGTVALMPFAVPLLVPGLTVDAWTVAEPLVIFLLLPMAAGMAVKGWAPFLASRLLSVVRPVAAAATLVLLAVIAVRFHAGFIEAVGSFAFATHLVYAIGVTVAAYAVGAGIPAARRNVLSLGACSRNLGAALAPLLVTPSDPRIMVMVAIGVPVTLLVSYLAAVVFARRAARANQ
jgi:BASS family bile acid:Na+ symporter